MVASATAKQEILGLILELDKVLLGLSIRNFPRQFGSTDLGVKVKKKQISKVTFLFNPIIISNGNGNVQIGLVVSEQ